jgi:hypothetical protein
LRRYSTDWIDHHTPIRVRTRLLAKEDYNAVRIGILRLGNPLHVEIRGIKGLECFLDDHAWVFIDNFINDLPLLAWTGFEPRESINAAITCELRLYHMHAGLLISRSLDALQTTIRTLVREKYGDVHDEEIVKLDER